MQIGDKTNFGSERGGEVKGGEAGKKPLGKGKRDGVQGTVALVCAGTETQETWTTEIQVAADLPGLKCLKREKAANIAAKNTTGKSWRSGRPTDSHKRCLLATR